MDYSNCMYPTYVPIVWPDQAIDDPRSSNDVQDDQIDQRNNLSGQVDDIGGGAYYWNNLNDASPYTDPNRMEQQAVSAQHNLSLPMDTLFSETAFSSINSCDINSTASNQLAGLYNAHNMNNSLGTSRWTLEEQTTHPPSSTFLAPELPHYDSAMPKGVPLPNPNLPRSTSQILQFRLPGDHTEQGNAFSTSSEQSDNTVNLDDPVSRIGSLLSNGKFICDNERCAGRTFARRAELQRHHTTLHATNKPNFWCQVPFCPRSMDAGGRPFHRKDKLKSHVRSMHPGA